MAIDIGDRLRLQATFTTVAGVATDPTGIAFSIREPDGTVTSYVFGTHAQLVNDATAVGAFYVDWLVAQSGTHRICFEGSGAVDAAEETTFDVVPNALARVL